MNAREPLLRPVDIADLRPTQITVGMREVKLKQEMWREKSADGGAAFLGRHMIPTVLGAKGRHFVIDNHHLALALHAEKVPSVLVTVAADLSALGKDAFWIYLDNRAWCHPYDGKGRRVDFADIPATVDRLKDDPYRSLAGELRHAGGFAKDTAPFSEFLWADFLRRRIKTKSVEKDFAKALRRAVTLARSQDAAYLPGWCGTDPID
ncbi:MAG: ParB-like protein [Caulobacteraceae bacterium]